MTLHRHLSLIVLIVANILPIIGVVRWGWNVFEIVALYWFENVVIGMVNVLKMLCSSPKFEETDASGNSQGSGVSGILNHVSKIFFIPFFSIHYGGFCIGHGIFVFALLGPKNSAGGNSGPFNNMGEWFRDFANSDIKWFALAIIASHVFSFFHNYIGKGEFRRMTAPQLMVAPYGRVVVLHIAIILGAFAIAAMGSSVGLLMLLIIGKIIIDAKLHLRAHRKAQGDI